MKIKHVSFDLWRTIIFSNKNFSKSRLEFLTNDFITKQFPKETIENAIRQISPLGDSYGEFFEVGFTSKQLYFMFLHQLYGKNTTKIIKETDALETLYQESLRIFSENIPPLISQNFPMFLENLHSKGITTNIASNTSFAGSEHLKKCLEHHKLNFNFLLFSENIGVFKPNPLFFYEISKSVKKIHTFCIRKQILHVGDNVYADIEGANKFGFESLLFTPETPNYEKILDYV